MSTIAFLSLFSRLKRLPRTGWLMGGIDKAASESIADHVSRTALITSVVSDAMNSGGEYSVNSEIALKMALLHDLPEVYISDVSKESTQYLGVDNKKTAEERATKDLLGMLPQEVRDGYWEALTDYRDQQSIESRIVRFSDKLEALLQALEYEKAGYVHGLTAGMLRDVEEAAKSCDNQYVNGLVTDVLNYFNLQR
jgi:5'-deoxynucleotidase YfbR-like HD superfamily hydrolase